MIIIKYQLISSDYIKVPQIISIGYSADPLVTRYGPAKRNQFIIHYVISGKGYFNGSIVLAGEGFIITPGAYEEYYPDKDDPWEFIWVISEDPSMQTILNYHRSDSQTQIFKFYDLPQLKLIADKLIAIKRSMTPNLNIAEMFLHIFNNCIVKTPTQNISNERVYLEYSINYIKSNTNNPISVTSLCSNLGISQPYLYKIFIKNLGVSPKQYITNFKLTQAKQMLCETDLSISQIAISLGFCDVLTFSKFFKQKTGISPTAFRKKLT